MNEAMPAEIDVPGPSNPDGSAAPAATSRDRCRRTLWFGFAGLLATLLIVFGDRNLPSELAALHAASFLHWMTISFIAGFTFRAVRRQVFFGAPMSLHRAFSFDAIFQGAILVHPQLPYPDVEREFLALQLELPPERVSPWFHIRSTSALAIPLVLAGVTVGLALSPVFGGALCVIGLVWIVYTASASAWTHSKRWRFVTAELLGVGAAVTEGAAFVLAARSVNLSVANWESFLLYAVLLTAFELSPVPLALGVLELAYLGLAGLPGLVLPGLLLPLAYRLWRATPVLLLMLFYLPRYKMSVRDLYDPRLPQVLASTRRRRSGVAGEEEVATAPLLSVVIPAYNEARRLPLYLPGVVGFCRQLEGAAEILVVDDGSTDGTAAYVESVSATTPQVRLVRQGRNQGKGAAVRRGVAEASGRYIIFADADGATPIREASKLLAVAEQGVDVVIGSRKAAGDSVHRERSFLRGLMGSIFYRVTNLLAVPGIADTQCGFKMFRRSAARRIFPLLTEKGWAFDVEVLFLAQKLGMAIEEVPVNWTAVEGSKVGPKDAFRMFAALLRIRRRAAGLTTGIGPPAQLSGAGTPGARSGSS